jgi:hypothetical protein
MRSLLASSLVGCGLMLFGCGGAFAQNYPPYGGDPYYGQPGYGRVYAGENGMALFERVQDDLNRAAFGVYGSRGHIDHARKEVGDVLRQLNRGRFDRGEMGEAIGAVDRVLDRDRLPERDRAMLWRDVAEMRRFRDQRY